MLVDCFVQAEKWVSSCSRGTVGVTKGNPIFSPPLLISTIIHSAGEQCNSLIYPVSMHPE